MTGGTVAIDDPPVRARCTGTDLPLGQRVRVCLVSADPVRREVLFSYPGHGVSGLPKTVTGANDD